MWLEVSKKKKKAVVGEAARRTADVLFFSGVGAFLAEEGVEVSAACAQQWSFLLHASQ